MYDGIVIKRIYERPIVGGGIADEIDFDSLKIANNQINFYGAKSRSNVRKFAGQTISFQTGEVVVEEKLGFLFKISIDKQFKSMNFSRIDNMGSHLNNQPEVVINTYEFLPRRKMNAKVIGNLGVFKNFAFVTKR